MYVRLRDQDFFMLSKQLLGFTVSNLMYLLCVPFRRSGGGEEGVGVQSLQVAVQLGVMLKALPLVY